MKKIPYLIIALFLITLLTNSCGKKCNKLDAGYQFEIPFTISPALDTFNIGDTISVSSEFSDMVYERNTGDYYLLEDYDFCPIIGIANIDSLRVGALDKVELIPEIPATLEGDNSIGIIYANYEYKNDRYTIRFKMVLEQSGLYAITTGSLLGVKLNPPKFLKMCKGEGVEGNPVLNNNGDNNKYLFEHSGDPYYNTFILKKEERTEGIYPFVVR